MIIEREEDTYFYVSFVYVYLTFSVSKGMFMDS